MIFSDPLTLSVLGNVVLVAALVGLSVHHYHTAMGDAE